MNTDDSRCDTSALCASVSLTEASKRQAAHLKSWFYQLLLGKPQGSHASFPRLKRHIYKVETRGRPSSLAPCGICEQPRCLVHREDLEALAIFIRITSEGSLKRIKPANGHPGSCCPHTHAHTPPRAPVPETLYYQRSWGGLHVGLLGWASVNTVSQDAAPAADTREHLKPDSVQLLLRPVSQVSTGRPLPCAYAHSTPVLLL